MYGFGDEQNPFTESVDVLEDLVIEYMTELVSHYHAFPISIFTTCMTKATGVEEWFTAIQINEYICGLIIHAAVYKVLPDWGIFQFNSY